MNERIKELLYKAGGEYGGEHPTTGQTVIYTDGVDCEKFAKLIVKECAQIADDGFASSNFGNGITGHQLLKHFGVD